MRVRTRILGIAVAGTAALIATATAAGQTSGAPADTTAARAKASSKSGADSTRDAVMSGSQLPSLGPRTLIAGGQLGYRSFSDEPLGIARAKLEEYKAIPTGPVLLDFLLGYTAGDSISVFQANGTNLGQRDQTLRLRGNSPGLYDLQARWDRVPHTFSTNARSLGSEPSQGVFVLPNPRPDTAAWNGTSPYLSPVRTLWNAVKGAAAYTPSSRWDLRAEYTNIGKTGNRPMGMAFGSPGNNLREILEPIDQTMHDVKLTESYSTRRFQVVGMYDLSLFRNRFTSAISDNPLVVTDQATAGSSRGRTALAPSNHAQTGVLNAAVSLPRRTRITASGSYSLWSQDEPFIPVTINSAITSPLISQIPKSLGGRSGTSAFNLSGVTRPLTPLTLSLRFRTFSFRDKVDVEEMPVLIVNDRSIAAAEERDNLPFTKRNTDAGASWRLTRLPLTFSAGYGWETWKRSEARNVADLRETSPRVAMDLGLFDRVTLNASYTTGRRRIHGEYIQNTPNDLPLHRRFDQANRDRERTNLLATVTPIDQLILSGTWAVGHDEYPDSPYGLQSDRSNLEGGDISWVPTRRLSVTAGLTREVFHTRLRSRYRATGQLDNLTYDWVANNNDVVRTASAGFKATLLPDRLEAGGRFDWSSARFLMATFNPTTPTGGTAAQNFAATASDLPLVTQKYQPMSLFATYLVMSDWGLTVRYDTERWAQNDFRTIGLVPAEGNGIFLANNLDDYRAGYFTISVTYRPRVLRLTRPAL
jgi:MtrB/PioB family decaheme-associated outer membrane protein